MIAAMLKVVSASAGSATMTRQTTLNSRVMTSSRDLKTTLATMLHRTVDGRGLVHSLRVPECHRWVNPVMSGGTPNTAGSYISAIRVRGNLIGTALRSSRADPRPSQLATAAAGRSPWLISYRCVRGLMLPVSPGTTRS